jgi:Type II CAAX prenyl endopeptidase Rce1-like
MGRYKIPLMNPKIKLFLILWLAGLAGILSFLLVDLNELLPRIFENFPLSERPEIPEFTPLLKVLSLIQPTIIMSLAVLAGVGLAKKVGLHAPASEALAGNGEKFWPALKPQIVPGILGGVCGGIAIVLASVISRSFLSPETVTRIAEFGKLLPVATRLLYGGILEEILLRWGLMTLLVWASWRLIQKGQDKPRTGYFWGAVLISSVIFGIGHLPIALMLFPPTVALIIFVIVANSMFGLIAGCLYWKKGLESAIIAHMLCHVTMLAASFFGAYF